MPVLRAVLGFGVLSVGGRVKGFGCLCLGVEVLRVLMDGSVEGIEVGGVERIEHMAFFNFNAVLRP